MSAAATAAGYLYASGRLRGRQAKEREEGHKQQPEAHESHPPESEIRVAAVPSTQDARVRRQPTIQYRTRRWRPDEPGKSE
jgi:hypothetical protein